MDGDFVELSRRLTVAECQEATENMLAGAADVVAATNTYNDALRTSADFCFANPSPVRCVVNAEIEGAALEAACDAVNNNADPPTVTRIYEVPAFDIVCELNNTVDLVSIDRYTSCIAHSCTDNEAKQLINGDTVMEVIDAAANNCTTSGARSSLGVHSSGLALMTAASMASLLSFW